MKGGRRVSPWRVERAVGVIDPWFPDTPQFVCEPLGDEPGVRRPVPQTLEDMDGL